MKIKINKYFIIDIGKHLYNLYDQIHTQSNIYLCLEFFRDIFVLNVLITNY